MSDAKTQDDDNQLHDALAAMTNDLLIVMVKRLGSPVTIPIAEIDGVKGLGLSMKIVGDDFEFDIIKDVSLPEAFVDIESSSMTKARYDGKTKSLHIVFKNGQQWRYHNFPTGVAYEFFQSDSKGSYFSRNIRGKYDESVVTEPLDGE